MFLAFAVAACGGSESSGEDATSSQTSNAGCDGYAEGAYKCDFTGSSSYKVCRKGSWSYGGSCTCTVYDGDPRKPPYASSCKYHGSGSIECSYAFKVCSVCDETGCH
jgi:hypothetical protein